MVRDLKSHQVFVFGSNLHGRHAGGAAQQAHKDFGAAWGIGVGLTGQCYAIPTMEGIDSLKLYVEQFNQVATMLPDVEFLLTKLGCGIAGYDEMDIAPLFKSSPANVVKPIGW